MAILSTVCFGVFAGDDFNATKQHARKLWSEHSKTFYCKCDYSRQFKVKNGDCIQTDTRYRWVFLNWEHIVPVSRFGRDLPCWNQRPCFDKHHMPVKKRYCCQSQNTKFSKMFNDMHNLVPVVAQVNTARQYYQFTDTPPNGEAGQKAVQGCDMSIYPRHGQVWIPESVRGWVARAYLYMASEYNLRLFQHEKERFHRWHMTYPPGDWEILWNQKVLKAQGTNNPYISEPREK